MPQATIPGSQPSSEENPAERNRREIEALKLARATQTGNSLSLTVRWRRWYATINFKRSELETIRKELQARVTVLTGILKAPEPFVTAETWQHAAEKLENAEAELSVVRSLLDGGSK